jgi:hypothetical protein
MRRAIALTVASIAVGCSSANILMPELGIEITEGVTATLQLDRDTVQVGDTLVVTLEVRNHRRETVELVTWHSPGAFVHTSLEGTSVSLVGGEGPKRSSANLSARRRLMDLSTRACFLMNPRSHHGACP